MILLLWIPVIFLIVYGTIKSKNGDYNVSTDGTIQQTIGIVLAFVLSLVLIVEPISSGAKVAEYEAFYRANYDNYGVAVDETASYLSTDKFEGYLIDGSIEKLSQAGYVSERIKEWRDEVNKFNINISRYRYLSTHPFIGILKPNLPDYIQPLSIQR